MAIKAQDVIDLAKSCIGIDKRKVIDTYNAHKPLAVGHVVQYYDAWCDTFLSYLFIVLDAVDLIGGTECGVERHIQLFKNAGIWEEDGNITPKPGYIICYNWDDSTQPNDGFADHIGIVTKVDGGKITLIEGNFNDAVAERSIPVGWGYIRGYAMPKYEEKQKDSVNPVSPSKMDISKPIIDVSEHQGIIDWDTVKPQIGGAIIRVAYSTKKNDNYYKRNLDECDRLGIPYGVYIYSLVFSEASARAEAAKVLELIKGRKLSLPIYIDLEENSYGYAAKMVAKSFCEAIKAAGYKCGIYSSEYYFRNFISGVNLKDYSPWIARYGTNDGTKQMNNRPSMAMDGWQYTSVGTLAGINGYVDKSEFYVTFDDEQIKPEPTPEPSKKSVEDLAREVIDGKWGNGEDRIRRLSSEGYDANAIQKKVNELLGASNKIIYEVKSGDTRSGIAAKYGVTYLKIAADNGIVNPNWIYAGQRLVINR